MSIKYLDPTGVGYFWYKIKSLVSAKYTKPDTGIPKSDLESSVQTTLTNADTVITNFSNKIDKVNGATAGNIAILNATGSIIDGNISIQNVELNVDTNGHTYVDLGLPSGTLWATCNVGATNPEDYGNYYAWGETQTKQEYSWNTYQHGSSGSNITKYNATDGKTELEPDDDVCHIVMGGDWKMPTEVQCRELIANTTYTWTTTNGITGILLTSTINNNTLFIPASGYINNTSTTDLTVQSCIWSSNLYIHETYGIMGVSELNYRETGSLITVSNDRYKGYPCRGVINKSGIEFKQGKTIMPVKTTASAVEFPDGETALSKVSNLEENKVDKVSGKSLSTNDYTTEDKTKLSNIASGAQVNVLETVKVNDNPLTITNKSVNIDLSNYAQKDGSYSQMTVGTAEDLASTQSVASEFTYRVTGGSTSVGKGGTEFLDRVKGRTVVWNQLVRNGDFAGGTAAWSFVYPQGASVSGGVLTMTAPTSVAGGNLNSFSTAQASIAGHKYYYKCELYVPSTNSTLTRLLCGPRGATDTTPDNSDTWYTMSGIKNISSANDIFIVSNLDSASVGDVYKIAKPMVIDLTLMFGSGNEPSTVAEFEALYPLPYYAYKPSKLINNGHQVDYDLIWNQLENPTSIVNGATIAQWDTTYKMIKITVPSGTRTSNISFGWGPSPQSNLVAGHVYLYKVIVSSNLEPYLGYNSFWWQKTGNSYIVASGAITAGSTEIAVSGAYIGTSVPAGTYYFCPMRFDLTVMFGAGNEPTSVAEFEDMFPLDFYPYDAGTQQSFHLPQFETGLKTVGFNLWDEEWEIGNISSSTGQNGTSTTLVRSKNSIKMIPGVTQYYLKAPSGVYFRWYDADWNYLPFDTNYTDISRRNEVFAPRAGATYLRILMAGTAYANDICISVSNSERNGTYEPHWEETAELNLGDFKVVSPNIWDEEWENGDITSSGANEENANKIRSKNYIPVVAGQHYYFHCPVSLNVFLFDASYNLVYACNQGSDTYQYWLLNRVHYIPEGVAYMRFSTIGNTITTYSNDITICESGHGHDGKYYPYGALTIQGGLKSAGTAYDEISGGKFVKRIETADMGSFNWSTYDYGTGKRHQTTVLPTGAKQAASGTATIANCLSTKYVADKYVTDGATSFTEDTMNMTYDRLFVVDSSYTDAATFKTAVTGVPLYYELATPEDFDLLTPIDTAIRNDPYGTEERIPADTAGTVLAPFRADITYSTNIKEAVEHLDENFISTASMTDFLTALNEQMNGTWSMIFKDGKYKFSFTPNPEEQATL